MAICQQAALTLPAELADPLLLITLLIIVSTYRPCIARRDESPTCVFGCGHGCRTLRASDRSATHP